MKVTKTCVYDWGIFVRGNCSTITGTQDNFISYSEINFTHSGGYKSVRVSLEYCVLDCTTIQTHAIGPQLSSWHTHDEGINTRLQVISSKVTVKKVFWNCDCTKMSQKIIRATYHHSEELHISIFGWIGFLIASKVFSKLEKVPSHSKPM